MKKYIVMAGVAAVTIILVNKFGKNLPVVGPLFQ